MRRPGRVTSVVARSSRASAPRCFSLPVAEEDGAEPAPPVREREPAREAAPARRHDARHVRAVPTTAEVKVERALELFNASEHPRTISGIARTLGTPWVHASPEGAQPSEVTIVVAWELSWYRYRVDLGDEHEPIHLLEKGDELGELEEHLRTWNASADENGQINVNVG